VLKGTPHPLRLPTMHLRERASYFHAVLQRGAVMAACYNFSASYRNDHSENMRAHRIIPPLVFTVLLISACGVKPTPGVTITAAHATGLSTNGSSPSPTPESLQTAAPETEFAATQALPQETTAPTGLNPAGPYAVFEGTGGIWIANPDGSFPTRIADQGIGNDNLSLPAAISSRGDRIAITVKDATGLNLSVVEIPSGNVKTIARLIDITRKELSINSLTAKAFAYYAITGFPSLAWQPGGGEILAYTGMGNGKTTDMYSFDFAWDKTRHIEQNPSQAISPIWSPDGSRLLYFGVEWLPPFGPAYVTFQPMAGFWAVQASDNQIVPLAKLKGSYRNFLGWQDNTHYLTYDSDIKGITQNLRVVDLTSGEETPIAEYRFSTPPAYSASSRAALISIDEKCGCDLEAGVYLLSPPSLTPVRLLEKPAFELHWLPQSGVFYAYPYALFSADGSSRYDPPVVGSSYRPAVSATGNQAWVVIENHQSRVMVRGSNGTWKTILEGTVGALIWDPGSGNTLLIAQENGALYSATAPDFTPRRMGDLVGYYDRAAWTPVT
jgi:hypothetical protein